jgi:hypothetical protein
MNSYKKKLLASNSLPLYTSQKSGGEEANNFRVIKLDSKGYLQNIPEPVGGTGYIAAIKTIGFNQPSVKDLIMPDFEETKSYHTNTKYKTGTLGISPQDSSLNIFHYKNCDNAKLSQLL